MTGRGMGLSGTWCALAIVGVALGCAPTPHEAYSYHHGGRVVVMAPAPDLVAVKELEPGKAAFLRELGFVRHALSDNRVLSQRGITVYQMRRAKGGPSPAHDALSLARASAPKSGIIFQPVFPSGMAVLIPWDEIIVGFTQPLQLAEARDYLDGHAAGRDIAALKVHREKAYIATIKRPTDGGCYQVCRALAALPGIEFAEPNHIVVPQH